MTAASARSSSTTNTLVGNAPSLFMSASMAAAGAAPVGGGAVGGS